MIVRFIIEQGEKDKELSSIFNDMNSVDKILGRLSNGGNNLECLNSEQVILAVEEYLKKAPYEYALMLNGEWGSGKSHLVRHELIPRIEQIDILERNELNNGNFHKKYKVVNISLYGISELSNLLSQISTSIIYQNEFWNTKAGEITKKIAPIVGAGLRMLTDLRGSSISIDKDGFSDLFTGIVQDFTQLNEFVFIFDDLERSSIPVGEVFGFLSNLIELNSVKTIIIANEKEIKDILSKENLYQKYLHVASVAEKIDFPEFGSSNQSISKQFQSKNATQKLDIDDLKAITERLFPPDENYKRFKEKVVGQTITYCPDLNEIIEPLMKKTFKKMGYSYQDSTFVLNNLSKCIASAFQSHACYNLRTAQMLLKYLGHLLPILIPAIKEKYGEENLYALHRIICSIVQVSIEHAKGTCYEDLKSIIGKLDYSESEGMNISYTFVADYFYFGILDKAYLEEIINTIADYFWRANGDPNSSLNKLSNFYALTESDVLLYYQEVVKEFKQGKYRIAEYPAILRNIINLYELELITKKNIEEIVSQMCENVKGRGEHIFHYDFTIVPEAESLVDYYKELLERINNSAKQSKNEPLSLMIQGALDDKKLYSQELKDYYYQYHNSYWSNYLFLANHDDVLTALKLSTAYDILELRQIVRWNYHNMRPAQVVESIESVRQFKNMLETALTNETHDFFDRIALKQAHWLKEDLERISVNVTD